MVKSLFSTLVLMSAAVFMLGGLVVGNYWLVFAGVLLVAMLLEGR